MYIFLKSNESDKIHKQNTKHSFTCEIPQEIVLQGYWTCAIVQCNIGLNKENQDITILSDIIQDSVLHGKLAPVFTILGAFATFLLIPGLDLTSLSYIIALCNVNTCRES